jgi:Ca2+-binding EF-hand superfamily protein
MLTEIVSSKILERFTAFSEAFIIYDANHTGVISRLHLEQGLRNTGFELSKKSVDMMCQRFSSASNPALIDYWALSAYFKTALSPSDAETTADIVEAELRVKMNEHFRSFHHAFLCFDVERSGRVGLKDFAKVLERFGIRLSDGEVAALERQTAAAMAAEAKIMPARKKRDVIFGGEDELKDEAAAAAAALVSKRLAIKYNDYIRHFRKVLQPEYRQKNKVVERGKRGKNVGHNAGHQIFGTKATALEGKQAQKLLARSMFTGLDEMHDAIVFFANNGSTKDTVSSAKFSEILLKFGIPVAIIDSLSAKYSNASRGEGGEGSDVDYVAFFDCVFRETAGLVAASFFHESQIILQVAAVNDSATAVVGVGEVPMPKKGPEADMVRAFFLQDGVARILTTWKLFDRSGGGKIQGGEFINAMRNVRSGRNLQQNKATALAELYDLDGTGRCDYIAFSRSFRRDLVSVSRSLKAAAKSRRSSLLVVTDRKSEEFRRVTAERLNNARLETQRKNLTQVQRKHRLLIPDSRIRSLVAQKRRSPRFRASFDAHNLMNSVRSHLAPQWQKLMRSFRAHDAKNKGVVSPSRFASIVLTATAKKVPKADVERLALAFVEFFAKDKTPRVSYERFMRHLVLKPKEGGSVSRGRPRPRSSRVSMRKDVSATRVPTRPGTAANVVQEPLGERTRRSDVGDGLSDACVLSVYGRWKLLRRAFAKIDAQRKGSVSSAMFCEVLQKNAFAMSTQDFAFTQARFGNGLKGIRYHDFLRHALKSMM